MPALSNSRHEAFARDVASGVPQTEAYGRHFAHRCTPKTLTENASRLAKKLRARIEELKGAAAAKVGVTVESLTRELDEAIQFAREQKDAGAMATAIKVKAHVTGHLVDPRKNLRAPIEDVPDDRLDAAIEQLSQVTGVPLPNVRH